jgi:hypothetical protein
VAEHAVLGALVLHGTEDPTAAAAAARAEALLANLHTLPPALRRRVTAMREFAPEAMARPKRAP